MKANNSILLPPPATSFKRNLLTLLIISSVAFLTPAQAQNLTINAGGTNGAVVDAINYEDGLDGPTVGHYYYLNKTSGEGDHVLTLTFNGAGLIVGAAYSDVQKFDPSNRIYGSATFISLVGPQATVKPLLGVSSTEQANGVYKLNDNTTPNRYLTSDNTDNPEKAYTPTTGSKNSQYILNVEISAGSSVTGKFYGGRNDYFGNGDGDSSYNTLNVTLGEDAVLAAQILFGGRSAQKEKFQSYSGYATEYNQVIVQGSSLKGKNAFNNEAPGNAEILSRAGIWGAEGWNASKNFVSIKDATLVGQSNKTEAMGVIGGRGFFSYRLNTGYADKGSLAYGTESAIANNNVVVISNSHLGLDSSYKWSSDNMSNNADATAWCKYSVFGGYSAGSAKDNIVVVENSIINGNVYGGFELQNQLTGQNGLRELHSNVVSLHNVKIMPGNAVYGTATADTVISTNSDLNYGADGQVFFNEDELHPVNRRRGIVYVAGSNFADSVYARYVHFGQYFDPNTMVFDQDTNVIQNFYLLYNKDVDGPANETDNPGLVRISNPDDPEAIKLGQLVAGSYVVNRRGFNSSLSQRNSNDSPSTNGDHNFWVAAYTNLTNKVDGQGKSLKTESKLFNGSEVRHQYEGGDLSLLTHDDGMVFSKNVDASSSTDHSEALMHNFRYHYDGLVLYLGVNNGKDANGQDVRSVAIDFDKIAKFREDSGQGTNAFGNTAIGIFMNADRNQLYYKEPIKGGNTSTSWEDMTIDIPGFEIYQGGPTPVAIATYGFYKYMHFDGKDETFTVTDLDGVDRDFSSKATGEGEEGGIGIKYWLKSLNVLEGQQLVLYGLNENETENYERGRYQLSAQVTGRGGLYIADNTTVVVGDPENPYQKQNLAENQNRYIGVTTVGQNAHLIQGINNALGSEAIHTQLLAFAKGEDGTTGSYDLMGFTQTVGGLDVAEGAVVNLTAPDGTDEALKGSTGGELTVLGPSTRSELATIRGNLTGNDQSKLIVTYGASSVYSANPDFLGTYALRNASAELYHQDALVKGTADISSRSSLSFLSSTGIANIYGIKNAGDVFLSGGDNQISNLNHVHVAENYAGEEGSVIHYRGLVQGPANSSVDVIHALTATGTSTVSFGDDHNKIPVSGVFAESRGEKTIKSEGIPIFVITDKGQGGSQLRLEMKPFGVVAKDDEAYKWVYSLGYNEDENGGRTWVLYNSDDDGDHYEPVEPEVPVLRPEAGAYVGASQSWAKMHMRLHDRFGQAYYIDPFDGEEKPAAAWVRQVGSHSHFNMGGGQSKSHSRTAVTQIGGDLLRNEFNEDWKYIGGVFAGGLYNRTDSRSWDSAKSRSDGYSLGIYGTLYTGNSPDDGFYVDSWLLFGRYDNKVWGDELSPFNYKSHGWVWSVETGYTIPLNETGTKDYNKLIWTFQPEAQLIWDGVKANSATDATGTKYRQLGTDNVTLRVGARLHANYMNKGLGFIEGNWIHNTKKAGVQMGSDRVYMDGGRNLGEFRMGLEGHITRNTLGWATFGVQAGKAGYHNETAQIGIKYMF